MKLVSEVTIIVQDDVEENKMWLVVRGTFNNEYTDRYFYNIVMEDRQEPLSGMMDRI